MLPLFCFLVLLIEWVTTPMSLLTTQVNVNIFFPTMSCINFYLVSIVNKKFSLKGKQQQEMASIADTLFEHLELLHI